MSGPPITPEEELAAREDERPFMPARLGELVDREGPPLEDECEDGWNDAFFFFDDDALLAP